jgi:methylmalonyl-CoA/ethylmalonyl-CoA epimerase
MTVLRRLDHVAITVRDTAEALGYFRDRLGLEVAHAEELASPQVRLTYLDAGNAYIQLLEPLDPDTDLAHWLEDNGEGIHHICFGVDDVLAAAERLSLDGAAPTAGSGRGRVSAFVPGPPVHGVRIECTEFHRDEDVDRTPGWLASVGWE